MHPPAAPRVRVLIAGSPADPSIEHALTQLISKHQDVNFDRVDLTKDRVEAKRILSEVDCSTGQAPSALLHFGWMHSLTPINLELLGPIAPQLKMVTSGGAGFDHITLSDFDKHGILYCNTPGAVATPTAEMAASMILQLLRQSRACDRVVRSGAWGSKTGKVGDRAGLKSSKSPRNCVLGILGLGTIGKIVAHRMQAFGMKCIYYNRRRLPPQEEQEAGVSYAESMEELLRTCDVLTLHLPLSKATHHLIGSKQFEMMKPGSYLVNTARGAVVDEGALVEALKSGQLAGAALDCFEEEPKVHPYLCEADNNVILSPHHGATVEEVLHDIDLEELAILDSFLSTGKPLNVIN